MPVIQACPFELFIVDGKAHGADQMKPGAGGGAGYISGVLGDFRLYHYNVQLCHSIMSLLFSGKIVNRKLTPFPPGLGFRPALLPHGSGILAGADRRLTAVRLRNQPAAGKLLFRPGHHRISPISWLETKKPRRVSRIPWLSTSVRPGAWNRRAFFRYFSGIGV